jgi:hypothetical protein
MGSQAYALGKADIGVSNPSHEASRARDQGRQTIFSDSAAFAERQETAHFLAAPEVCNKEPLPQDHPLRASVEQEY